MIDTVQAISICPQVIQKQFNSSNTICKLWYEMIVFCTDDSFSIIQTQFELVLIISKWSITTVSDSTHHFQNYQTWYFGTLKDVLVSYIKLSVAILWTYTGWLSSFLVVEHLLKVFWSTLPLFGQVSCYLLLFALNQKWSSRKNIN